MLLLSLPRVVSDLELQYLLGRTPSTFPSRRPPLTTLDRQTWKACPAETVYRRTPVPPS